CARSYSYYAMDYW
nr:immunoglobulin heavy chain junction region [Mus musculus]